mmetsp:Transcript_18637/g.39090  ORF Transcript_18637/g.39090 Transcript_18637/m.39090 type:complete len:437 (+) Transcript_18637:467-1777(+)
MLLTNLPHGRSNVGIPRRTHSGEQMVLHLKVEPSGQIPRNGTSVSRRCFDLGFEPAYRFARIEKCFRGVAVGVFKVVGEGEKDAEGQTLGDSHEHDDSEGGQVEAVVGEWAVNIQEEIHGPHHYGVLPPLDNEIILHLNSHIGGSGMTKVDDLRVENHGEPIHGQNGEEINTLEAMVPPPLGMSDGIIIKIEDGLGAETVGVLIGVVGIGMVSPMLGQPGPFASPDEIGSKSEQIVDPRLFGGGSVIGIVLHVQADGGAGHSKGDGEENSLGGVEVGGGGEGVLEEEEEGDVDEGSEEKSGRSEFAAAAHNFEDFGFDFAFEFRVEFVFRLVVVNLSNGLHLLQMLRGMVRMNHLVLHGDIIPPEKFHHLSSRMDEVGNVVNDPVDCDFGSFEAFDGSHGLGGGIGVDISGGDRAGGAGDALAEAGDVGVGWHGGG